MQLRAVASLALLFALAACAGPQPAPDAPRTFTGEAKEASVGGRMVNHRSTTVTDSPFVGRSKANGKREAFTYLGLLESDARGKTIRVRYERWKIVDDVESPTVDERAEIRLDLSLGDVLVHAGWSIGVVEANERTIRYVAVQGAK